jgi:hypothetical protein
MKEVQQKLDRLNLSFSLLPLANAIDSFGYNIPVASETFKTSLNAKKNKVDIQIKGFQSKNYNDKLVFAERHFIDMNGIAGRSWYRHAIYAPGEWTGYKAQGNLSLYTEFPAIHEAIDKKGDVDKAIKSVSDTILNVVKFWNE